MASETATEDRRDNIVSTFTIYVTQIRIKIFVSTRETRKNEGKRSCKLLPRRVTTYDVARGGVFVSTPIENALYYLQIDLLISLECARQSVMFLRFI